MRKYLICVVGATAVGKTAMGLGLAEWLESPILSCDSRQIYKEIPIGTAQPSPEELQRVEHVLIGSHSVREGFSPGDFEQAALNWLTEWYAGNAAAVLVGGSGLYLDALLYGLDDIPATDMAIRTELTARAAGEEFNAMQEELRNVDPVLCKKIDINNRQRVIRALEVYYSTGRPLSDYQTGNTAKRDFIPIIIGLDLPRALLYDRINKRVDTMLESGWAEEARAMAGMKRENALNTVGYKEIFAYLDGHTDLATTTELIKRNTRRLAKRQITWFKKYKDARWFHPDDVAGVKAYITERMAGVVDFKNA